MLSYQHAYHAGNLADVHKHAGLAAALAYLTRKDKPLSYIETHAGRGFYDLSSAAARKTAEAAAGIGAVLPRLDPGHPYAAALARVRARHGPDAYPGSPMIAAELLRPSDRLDLAELHPGEHAALRGAMAGTGARLHAEDGLALARRLTPPTPRRGLMLLDPSYEVKRDYDTLATAVPQLAKRWNVGILMLWYPLLRRPRHTAMLAALRRALPQALAHEVRFPPARAGHGMIGSGLFVVNPPWGLDSALAALVPVIETGIETGNPGPKDGPGSA